MNKINKCLDCGCSLHSSAKRCSCGWRQTEVPVSTVTDYRCQFRGGGVRCDEIGNMSHSKNGQVWYCRDHYHQIKNSRLRGSENIEKLRVREARLDWTWAQQLKSVNKRSINR
jgi:hypothetical protein